MGSEMCIRDRTLDDFLADEVFHGETGVEMQPDPKDVEGFDEYLKRYKAGLPIERAAVDSLK